MATQMPSNAAMGKKLRELREERGIKREQVALALDMGAENWRHYEAGRTKLTLPMLPKIADAYGLDLARLIGELFYLPEDADTVTHEGSPGRKTEQQNSLALYLDWADLDPLRTARAPVRELVCAGR